MNAERERSSLQEKLSRLQHEMSEAVAGHARQKREMDGQIEQQTNSISNLQAELRNLHSAAEQTRSVLVSL